MILSKESGDGGLLKFHVSFDVTYLLGYAEVFCFGQGTCTYMAALGLLREAGA